MQAYDSDSGDFGAIFYTGLQGKFADLFKLDPVTGDITVLKDGDLLDRETIPEVYLSVEAKDSRGQGNRATAQIRIILDDINDNAPMFDTDFYEATLMENHFHFLRPLFVHATDRDASDTPNSRLAYAIKPSQYSGHFAVNSNGEVCPDQISKRIFQKKKFFKKNFQKIFQKKFFFEFHFLNLFCWYVSLFVFIYSLDRPLRLFR